MKLEELLKHCRLYSDEREYEVKLYVPKRGVRLFLNGDRTDTVCVYDDGAIQFGDTNVDGSHLPTFKATDDLPISVTKKI